MHENGNQPDLPPLPPLPPLPYESLVPRGTSVGHVYLTPGQPTDEEQTDYLEPRSQHNGDR